MTSGALIYDDLVKAPLVVGLGRVGVAISGLAPNLPQNAAPAGRDRRPRDRAGPGIAVALRAALASAAARAPSARTAPICSASSRESRCAMPGIDVELLRATVGTSACELVTTAADGTLRTRYPGDAGDAVAIDATAAVAGAPRCCSTGPRRPISCAPPRSHAARPAARDLRRRRGFDDRTSELIAASDILIASERAAGELAPRGELTDALDELVAIGPRAVVITLGAKGAIGRHGDQVVKCPAFPSDVLDAYGAGSVFHGAFAAALLSELPFARCIELAAAAASLSLRELGPWSAMPTRDDGANSRWSSRRGR